jgi:parallel beta-helix repeat protein
LSNNDIHGNGSKWQQYSCVCYGAIHLDAVVRSIVRDNEVSDNAEGIVLTDEAGPTHDNLIVGNSATNNQHGSGVALVAANSQAAGSVFRRGLPVPSGKVYPSEGGLFRNIIRGNTLLSNGTAPLEDGYGAGAGVLLDCTGQGFACYENSVVSNSMFGNGLSGVAVHADYGGGMGAEYFASNRIVGNTIGRNNLLGDGLGGTFTGPLRSTAGVVVLSGAKTTTVVMRNHITNDVVGVWRNPAGTLRRSDNSFSRVDHTDQVVRSPFGELGCDDHGTPWVCGESGNRVTLKAVIVANGTPTKYYFKYGTDPYHLDQRTRWQEAGADVIPEIVSATVSIDASQYYYAQLVATNAAGTIVPPRQDAVSY